MVGTLTSIYHGEESLSIQAICARYRGRPARARWEQNNRSLAQPAEYFREGTRAIRTFSGKHSAVHCLSTALQSPYRHFCLGLRPQHEGDVPVMQLVSYSPHSLAFTFVLYHSSCARKASCCSSLAFPIPPFLSPVYHTHTPMFCLTHLAYMHTYSTYCTCCLISSHVSNVYWRWFLKSKLSEMLHARGRRGREICP